MDEEVIGRHLELVYNILSIVLAVLGLFWQSLK